MEITKRKRKVKFKMILNNKPIDRNITFKEVNTDYNILRDYSLKNNITDLNLLNDYELFIFIVANTLNHRDLKSSIKNALYHLENKENAIKCFSASDREANLI